MTGTIVNDLTGLFKNQALVEAAAQLGESESSVLRGFEAASSAIMGAFTSHVGQSGFMKQAYDLITSPLNDGGMLSNIRGMFSRGTAALQSDGLGGRLLSMLFGSDQTKVTEGISQRLGLKASSATVLMAAAAPMVLGSLGRRVKESHLDVYGLSNLLQNETGAVRTEAPAYENDVRKTSSNRWLWPLLLAVLAVIGLFWYFNRGRGVVDQATDAARSVTASLGDFLKQTLPNGVELNIPRFGVEAKLLSSIQDSSTPVDNTPWFDFDRLVFDTNSAMLRPESQEQLTNIAYILKAYPTVHVKIGGHADSTGDQTANMQLSQARANSVVQSLVSLGVGPDRMAAQGYGESVPLTENSTEAGRLQNRRVALRLTAR